MAKNLTIQITVQNYTNNPDATILKTECFTIGTCSVSNETRLARSRYYSARLFVHWQGTDTLLYQYKTCYYQQEAVSLPARGRFSRRETPCCFSTKLSTQLYSLHWFVDIFLEKCLVFCWGLFIFAKIISIIIITIIYRSMYLISILITDFCLF